MPFQVKAGSLVIVAINSVEAFKVFESLKADTDQPIFIRDMDGFEIDPGRLQRMSEPDN